MSLVLPHPKIRTISTVGYPFTPEISEFVEALTSLGIIGKRFAEYEIVTDIGGMPLIILRTSKEMVDLEDLLKFWFYERRELMGASKKSSRDGEGEK